MMRHAMRREISGPSTLLRLHGMKCKLEAARTNLAQSVLVIAPPSLLLRHEPAVAVHVLVGEKGLEHDTHKEVGDVEAEDDDPQKEVPE